MTLSQPDEVAGKVEPVLDMAYLDQLALEIGEDGVSDVLRMFREDAPARALAIRTALRQSQMPMLRREAHALAGAARNVGLVRLGQQAYDLQRALELAEPDPAAVARIIELTGLSLEAVAAWSEARAHAP